MIFWGNESPWPVYSAKISSFEFPKRIMNSRLRRIFSLNYSADTIKLYSADIGQSEARQSILQHVSEAAGCQNIDICRKKCCLKIFWKSAEKKEQRNYKPVNTL